MNLSSKWNGCILEKFILLRLILVPIIKTWFVPDETWQVTEVAHNWIYGYGYLTWEWHEGIRSIFYPGVFAVLFKILSVLQLDYILVLVHGPRALSAIIFAIGDYYILKVSNIWFGGSSSGWIAVSLTSSWFLAYCAPRTLSSCVEMTLYALTLYNYPWHKEKAKVNCGYLWWVGLGCLIRPTIVFTFLPFFIQHIFLCKKKLNLIRNCCPIILFILILSITLDSLVYGKFTVVPWNFIHFNVVKGLSIHYGTLPWHWYFTQGLPVTCGIHLIPLLYGLNWNFKKYRKLLLPCLWSLFIHSLLGHKEFRFILPIIPSLLCIAGDSIHSYFDDSSKPSNTCYKLRKIPVLLLLIIPNVLVLVYIGCVHQIGPLEVVNQLHGIVTQHDSPSIMFLTPCHSTPLYSHLHLNVPVRFLTCEPNLLEKQDYLDEADIFFQFPIKWMEREYNQTTSSNKELILPSHIVMYNSLEIELHNYLEDNGYILCSEVFNAHFYEDRRGRYFYIYCKA